MNAALYLLNVLALVAVVSFHFFGAAPERQVNIDVRDWVQHPTAQRAGMHERAPVATTMASSASTMAMDRMLPAPSRQLDRFTF